MNYLAHAFLSNDDPDLLVGNFIADHLRGNNLSGYPEKVIQGIRLHRQIDSFTDSHQDFRTAKRFFYEGYEKYSGILVDIFFDHYLAKNFQAHTGRDLSSFTEKVYQVYTDNRNLFPSHSDRFLNYVLKNRVYNQYANLHEVKQVLEHLSFRIGHGVPLQEATLIFEKNSVQLSEKFSRLLGDAVRRFLI